MLLNNFLKTAGVFLIIILFVSCGDKNDDILPRIDFENKLQMSELSKKKLGNDVVTAFGGFFDDSPRKKIAVMLETDENIDWGIKFVLLEEKSGNLEINHESKILSGSHKESFIDKIKFPSFDHELLYYNSKGYFMGTGGGEVFSYIVNFNDKEIYYAHLIVNARNPVSLFISPNSTNKDVKDFFIRIFKVDYPSLKLVDEDIAL
ncbi:MAG: hypothetical protein R6W68_04840 [Ignavibacteriaceae bacterium]